MFGLLLYEVFEILFYTGKLAGKGIYAIYEYIYGSTPDETNPDDVKRIAELEKRIAELEKSLSSK